MKDAAESPTHLATKTNKERYVSYGMFNALKRVAEWNTDKILRIYDTAYYRKLSGEERAVADRTRSVIEKRAKVLGWVATGAEVAAVVLGAAKGYELLKKKFGSVPEPAGIPRDIPGTVASHEAASAAEAVRSRYHPGTVADRHIYPVSLLETHRVFYDQILAMDEKDPEKAQALFYAALAFMPDVIRYDQKRILGILHVVSPVIASMKTDEQLRHEFWNALPFHHAIPAPDTNHFMKALSIFETGFGDHGAGRSTLPPIVPLNFLSAVYFPESGRIAGRQPNDPVNPAIMRGLHNAFVRKHWTG